LRAVHLQLGLAQIQIGQLCHSLHNFPADFQIDFPLSFHLQRCKILAYPRRSPGLLLDDVGRLWIGDEHHEIVAEDDTL
jgi:hypothetical protein